MATTSPPSARTAALEESEAERWPVPYSALLVLGLSLCLWAAIIVLLRWLLT